MSTTSRGENSPAQGKGVGMLIFLGELLSNQVKPTLQDYINELII